jgi:CMP/dCMP kinase
MSVPDGPVLPGSDPRPIDSHVGTPPFVVVAMDGGAASGKSSTAKRLAEYGHLLHVDTGSHYRAVTMVCLERGLPAVDSAELTAFLGKLVIDSEIRGRAAFIRINGEVPANRALRTEAVNRQVSHFAALPCVRERVKQYQRDQVALARGAGFRGIVMDGRDIGTVILPHANFKFFLQADEATRRARRADEGQADTIADRDRIDSTRALAPLQSAADAAVIDNSDLSLEAVVELVASKIGIKIPRAGY